MGRGSGRGWWAGEGDKALMTYSRDFAALLSTPLLSLFFNTVSFFGNSDAGSSTAECGQCHFCLPEL